MSRPRRAWLSLVAGSFVGAIAIACSSFTSTDGTVAQDGATAEESAADAGTQTDTSEPADASDAGDDAATRFCAHQPATVLLCDDFEENDGGLVSAWQLSTDGGTIAPSDAPMRSGHAVKISTSGEGPSISLHFDFSAPVAIAGLVFEADVFLDTVGYDYVELAHLHMAGSSTVYFGGLAKSGDKLGRQFNPLNGPTIPVGQLWHHLRVELARDADAGFSQTVTIDTTVVDQTSQDLTTMSAALIELGVLIAATPPGTPVAVLYFDNVLLRPR